MKGVLAILCAGLLAWSATPAFAPAESVLVARISGEIDVSQRTYIKRLAERALEEKPSLVILEIDTPGGRVDYTLSICEDLLRLKEHGIRTIAFITRSEDSEWLSGAAASAGAFISLACEKIYMGRTTVIGASQPVVMSEEGSESAGGKAISFLKKKIAAIAEANGYPAYLAMAMVDPEFQVYEVQEQEGLISFMTHDEVERTKFADGKPAAKLITKKGEPLTLTVREAVRYGVATEASSRDEILKIENAAALPITTLERTWEEDLVSFLTSSGVQFVLFLLMFFFGYLELQTPGFAGWGVAAILCLVVMVFGHQLAGLANLAEILILIAGIVLIAVELFVVPGTMVSGILGAIAILTGLIMLMMPTTLPDFENPFQMDLLVASAAKVVLAFLSGTAVFLVAARFFRQIPVVSRLALQGAIGGTAAADSGLVGKEGTVTARLAPGGKADIQGNILDVVTESGFLDRGTRIRVVQVDGSRIVVEPVE